MAQTVDAAQVRAEAAAANQAGLIANGEALPETPLATLPSDRSRADVHAEAVAALAAGQTVRGDQGYAESKFESTKTRAEIHAEAATAVKLGLVSRGEV